MYTAIYGRLVNYDRVIIRGRPHGRRSPPAASCPSAHRGESERVSMERASMCLRQTHVVQRVSVHASREERTRRGCMPIARRRVQRVVAVPRERGDIGARVEQQGRNDSVMTLPRRAMKRCPRLLRQQHRGDSVRALITERAPRGIRASFLRGLSRSHQRRSAKVAARCARGPRPRPNATRSVHPARPQTHTTAARVCFISRGSKTKRRLRTQSRACMSAPLANRSRISSSRS